MIRLILFDMDDTLYPERDYVMSGFNAVSEHLAAKYGNEQDRCFSLLKRSFEENGRGRNFDYAIEKLGLDKQILFEVIQVYRSHSPAICLRKDITEFLTDLSCRVNLCLITDGWVEVQQMKVSALGLDRYFRKIIFSQENGLAYAKPHEHFFIKALDYFGVSPEESLMVGDDFNKDIIGGQNVGMKTFQVSCLLDRDEQSHILEILEKG